MSPPTRGFRVPVQRLARRARQLVVRRLYRDLGGGPEAAVLVAGTARSGTTWLGELLADALAARVIFEPFHPELVPECAAFGLFAYRRPGQPDEELRSFARRVFSGELKGPWVDRYAEVLRPRRRVVKEIRANLCLGWLKRTFPEVPLFFVLRHPCAVVASRMALGWATDADLAPMLAQQELVEDHLSAISALIQSARDPVEKHALIWCITNSVPLSQLAPEERVLVFYEHLCGEPTRELARIARALGPGGGSAWGGQAGRASMTAVGGLADAQRSISAWQRQLTPAEIARVLSVVREYGLGDLYGDAPDPLVRADAVSGR